VELIAYDQTSEFLTVFRHRSAVTASAGSIFCRDFLLCSFVCVSLLCAVLVGVACVFSALVLVRFVVEQLW
jgi:hypothetical protein